MNADEHRWREKKVSLAEYAEIAGKDYDG